MKEEEEESCATDDDTGGSLGSFIADDTAEAEGVESSSQARKSSPAIASSVGAGVGAGLATEDCPTSAFTCVEEEPVSFEFEFGSVGDDNLSLSGNNPKSSASKLSKSLVVCTIVPAPSVSEREGRRRGEREKEKYYDREKERVL